MKKIIVAILVVASLLATLTACGKFTCDICNEEKSGKKHEDEFLGEKIVVCDDCYEDLEDIADAFN